MKQPSIFYNNILNDLKELSDLEYQKRVWLGKDDHATSSFVELYCRLFDDDQFDMFVDEYADNLGISNEIRKELLALRTLLNNYEDSNKENDLAILEDPDWHIVVAQAQQVVRMMSEWLERQ